MSNTLLLDLSCVAEDLLFDHTRGPWQHRGTDAMMCSFSYTWTAKTMPRCTVRNPGEI